MKIDVTLPGLLAESIGVRSVSIHATTLAQAIAALRQHEQLGPLIFDDAGKVRPHVLLFHNDTATRHMTGFDIALRDGDRIAIVQAVSGG